MFILSISYAEIWWSNEICYILTYSSEENYNNNPIFMHENNCKNMWLERAFWEVEELMSYHLTMQLQIGMFNPFSMIFHLSSRWHQWNKYCCNFIQNLNENIINTWKFDEMGEIFGEGDFNSWFQFCQFEREKNCIFGKICH